jgi:hypothetical protein
VAHCQWPLIVEFGMVLILVRSIILARERKLPGNRDGARLQPRPRLQTGWGFARRQRGEPPGLEQAGSYIAAMTVTVTRTVQA